MTAVEEGLEEVPTKTVTVVFENTGAETCTVQHYSVRWRRGRASVHVPDLVVAGRSKVARSLRIVAPDPTLTMDSTAVEVDATCTSGAPPTR